MNKKIKNYTITIAVIITLLASLGFVNNDFKLAKNLDIYVTLFKELNLFYVDDVDPDKLVKTSIDEMLESLDPYTNFIPEQDLDDFKTMTTGQYGGIGSLIQKKDKNPVISEPYYGCPAQKAGLKAGDIILEIDNTDVNGKDISDISSLLKGTPNTEVKVLIKRPYVEKELKIEITREKISIPNVPYYGIVYDTIGYIKLANFTTDAGKEVRNAVEELKKQNAKAYILDLRGNPGGLLIEAVNIVSVFVEKGLEVVRTRGKVKQFDAVYTTSQQPVDIKTPLVVLVSRSSASASEIVSGALQDLDRAILIGQRTFGKGLVQSTRPLSYNTQLKVTTAKYYIPSGRCIQALDYSHRNDDGSVGHVPDSLISEFETKHGRRVYDGGGVMPDVKTDVAPFSNISMSLLTKNMIFDYATYFAFKNTQITNVANFKITDSIYIDFTNFIADKDFDYKTKSEESLSKLIETAKKEKYYDSTEVIYSQLKEKLAHNKTKDLVTFRSEIEEMLADEIVSRYYYQKGRIMVGLTTDREMKKAFEIIARPWYFNAMLEGKEGELAKINSKVTKKAKMN